MRTLSCLGLVLVVGAAVRADDAKKEFDPAKLVGEWTYVSGQRSGDKVEKDRLAATVTISKDTFTIPSDGGQKFVMAYKIDAKASPAKIDWEIKEGPVNEGKAEGIIALEGDEIKLCYVVAGSGERPKKFESTKDNGTFLFVLKRKK